MKFPLIASKLKTATTQVNIASAPAPTSGQVLTATSSTTAAWQTPSAWASFNWINGQSFSFPWEIVPWKIAELTAFNNWTFAEMQISTLTRTTWTTTVTLFKNGVSQGTVTITSATALENTRYFWVSTWITWSFVNKDVFKLTKTDTGSPWSTSLEINMW